MQSRFDDIIFQGRFREYGAYSIRRSYNKLVVRAFLYSTLVIVLLLSGLLFGLFTPEPPAISVGDIIATYEMMSKDDMQLPEPPGDNMKKQDETILAKPDLTTQPIVVKERNKNIPDPEKKKPEIIDSTAKTGEKPAIKGEGEGSDTNFYFRVEKLPEFPGGRQGLDKYLRDNIRYPAAAVQKKVKGTVYVCFKVSRSGKVYDVKVTKSVDPDIDREAIRVVRGMPVWSPGRRHGEAVNVIQVLPIKFFLAA